MKGIEHREFLREKDYMIVVTLYLYMSNIQLHVYKDIVYRLNASCAAQQPMHFQRCTHKPHTPARADSAIHQRSRL